MAGSWERLGAAWAGITEPQMADEARKAYADLEDYYPQPTLKERMARCNARDDVPLPKPR